MAVVMADNCHGILAWFASGGVWRRLGSRLAGSVKMEGSRLAASGLLHARTKSAYMGRSDVSVHPYLMLHQNNIMTVLVSHLMPPFSPPVSSLSTSLFLSLSVLPSPMPRCCCSTGDLSPP